jgi:cell division protein FtsX
MPSNVKMRGGYKGVGKKQACEELFMRHAILSFMNRKPSLARRMWLVFAVQLAMTISITTACITATVVMLHAIETTNQGQFQRMPFIQQHLQKEQDPVKLRQETSELWDLVAKNGESQESDLRFLIKIFAMFGVALFVFSLSSGICAYKLQREAQNKDLS